MALFPKFRPPVVGHSTVKVAKAAIAKVAHPDCGPNVRNNRDFRNAGEAAVGVHSQDSQLSQPCVGCPPCPGDVHERAAALELKAGHSRDTAEGQALAEAGYGSWPAFVAAHASVINSHVADLPLPANRLGRRLHAETPDALASPWFAVALRAGWSIPELFGMWPDAPVIEIDRMKHGLFCGLILSPHRPQSAPKLVHLDSACFRVRYPSGSTLTGWRYRPDLTHATVWWKHPGVVGSDTRGGQ